MRRAEQRRAEPDQDHADVLDRGIREQPFEIVLRQRKGDAEQRRSIAPSPITSSRPPPAPAASR